MRDRAVNGVELVGVDKDYGEVRALSGVNAVLEPGTLTHVSGPNGAGKSTLLRVIAGLTRPSRGRVVVYGMNLFRSTHAASRGAVGYLGPGSGLYGELTLDQNLRFCARVHGAPPARIEAAVERLELKAIRSRPVSKLSLGFRRRAGLARLLVCTPALWLLDEPWNGLDAQAASLLAEMLGEQREAGHSALVAAPVLGEQAALFDRALALREGRVEKA
jgi:heme ABC exporter ATP-binding subunit CcmA